jgi:ABC-type bacteriocin/lantibiotic exporter with double-glycine peptidase domain
LLTILTLLLHTQPERHNQIGKITAFMREMANIRQFMTGNSLTLVIDLIFVVVFFSVMFIEIIRV